MVLRKNNLILKDHFFGNKYKIKIRKADTIESLRNKHLKSLPEFQELYLELMIPNADKYLLIEESDEIGNAIIKKNRILIEFFLSTLFPSLKDSNICFIFSR